MPTFQPPVANDRPPVYLTRDHYRPVPKLGQRLMSHFGAQPRGRTVLKVAGVYATYDYPTQDQIDSATEVYLGGHVYEVTQTVADALVAAGYSVS